MQRVALLFSVFFSSLAFAEEPIRLGATLPLSGDLASYGELIRGGIELAIEDLKRTENIFVDFYPEDVPMSGLPTLTALRSLINVKKIDALAGNFSNVAMAGFGADLTRSKLPTMHTAANDDLILRSSDWILSTNVRIRDEAEEMANYLFSKRGFKKVGVISIQTNFGENYHKAFVAKFKDLGGIITSEQYFGLGDSDYRTQITRLKASEPEAVYLGAFGPFLGRALKQSKDLGLTVPTFSVYESEDTSVVDAAVGAAEGLKYFVTFDDSPGSMYSDFAARYQGKFKRVPGTFGSNSYDATMLLVKALKECKKEKECTRQKLLQVRNYDGVSGKFSIGVDGKAQSKSYRLREIRGGKFVNVAE